MIKSLKKILSDEHGGIDNIIVSLLFVFISVLALLGLSTWNSNNKDNLEMQAIMKVNKLLEENAPASSGNMITDYEEDLIENDTDIEENIIFED